MLVSLQWLNRYLDPADLTAEDAVAVLERTSFPIEDRHDLPSGDVRLDVELTSNRGDCFSHLNLAREIAAVTDRRLLEPASWTDGSAARCAAADAPTAKSLGRFTIDVHTPDACPRFTARIIRGVKVGPSPAWLRELLEAVGQRPINNIVDISNFALYELGHPSHAFDLAALADEKLTIRWAKRGEQLDGLDGHTHELTKEDLVIADADGPASLAGIVGGRRSGVTEQTTDVLLEVATWDPEVIRRTARRLNIATDAGYRFERCVDPRDLARASNRIVELILEVAGGRAEAGMIDIAGPLPAAEAIEVRPHRCRKILGVAIGRQEMQRHLENLGFHVEVSNPGPAEQVALQVTPPPMRAHDVKREIDVIEEVARLHQIDAIPVAAALPVRFDFDHPATWEAREQGVRAAAELLTAHGFFETVTFSFATAQDAELFLPTGLHPIKIDEQRRRETPYLRPSALPGLLQVRQANAAASVQQPGGIRLFEIAAVFADADEVGRLSKPTSSGSSNLASDPTVERHNIAMLADLPAGGAMPQRMQAGVRLIRGVIESLAERLTGGAKLEVAAVEAAAPAYQGGICAGVTIAGRHAGLLGIVPAATTARWDLEEPLAFAELGVAELLADFPPEVRVEAPPRFPAIERDLSVVLAEAVSWAELEAAVLAEAPEHLEAVQFVGGYRGKQVGPGRKSLTLRLRFRDPQRTLRHEDADEPVARIVARLESQLGGELRR